MILPWRVYRRPKAEEQPSEFLGCVHAETRDEALGEGYRAWHGKTLDVVSEIAWQGMSERDRAIFTGTFDPPPPDTDTGNPNVRRTWCIVCNAEILYGRSGNKWRQPPKRCKGVGCERAKKSRWIDKLTIDTVTVSP